MHDKRGTTDMASVALGCDRTVSTAISRTGAIVFVVDDDAAIRASVERLIRSAQWEAQSFGSAQEFLAHPRSYVPSCLILDVSLPGLDGFELQQRIAADRLDMPIIFITGHGDVPMSVKAMRAGAIEFLTKPFNDDTLLDAVARAIELSEAVLGTEAETRALHERYRALSTREREVMDRIVAGKLNKQVGGELGISEITVKGHRGRVMRKMRAGTFADLVKMAARLRPEQQSVIP